MTDQELAFLEDSVERLYSLFYKIQRKGKVEITPGVYVYTKEKMQKDQGFRDEGVLPASFEKAKWWVVWTDGPTEGFNEFFQAVHAALEEAIGRRHRKIQPGKGGQ